MGTNKMLRRGRRSLDRSRRGCAHARRRQRKPSAICSSYLIEPFCPRSGLHRSHRPRYEFVCPGSITSQVIAWIAVLSHDWIAKELHDGETALHAQPRSSPSDPKRCVGRCGTHANAFHSGPIRTQSYGGGCQSTALRTRAGWNETLRAGLGIGSPSHIPQRLDFPIK
jgi:hypothetical protein